MQNKFRTKNVVLHYEVINNSAVFLPAVWDLNAECFVHAILANYFLTLPRWLTDLDISIQVFLSYIDCLIGVISMKELNYCSAFYSTLKI